MVIMKSTNSVYTGLPTTIFEEMSRLAAEYGAINLGQGFPDVDGPEDIRRKAAEALLSGPNQYPRMLGVPELRAAVSHAWQRFQDLEVDPDSEVLVVRRHGSAFGRDQRAGGARRRGCDDRAAL